MLSVLAIGLVVALGAAIRGNWSPCGESLQAKIHPLGERSRGNVWGLTMASFTLGSVLAAASLTGLMGLLGMIVQRGAAPLALPAALALAAGMLDLSPLEPWTPRRQVNEDWIGRYRGWVYGIGFGLQLGLGFAVFVMSWGYWAMLAIAFIGGSVVDGMIIGTVFGLGRGLILLLSRKNTTPQKLAGFHQSMMFRKSIVFRGTGAAMLITGLVSIL